MYIIFKKNITPTYTEQLKFIDNGVGQMKMIIIRISEKKLKYDFNPQN